MSKTRTPTKYSKSCHKTFKARKLRNAVARFSDLEKETWNFAKACYVYHGAWNV